MTDRDWGGPYLVAACFCDDVEEGEQGTISIVGMLDSVEASGSAAHLVCRILVAFLPGGASGPFDVRILESGTGRPLIPPDDLIPEPSADPDGPIVVAPPFETMLLPAIYWFDVLINGRLMTRLSLRVLPGPVTVTDLEGLFDQD